MKTQNIVLDTNILVSALMSPKGKPAQIHKMFMKRSITLIVSQGIIDEYIDVLHRVYLHLDLNDVGILLAAIDKFAKKFDIIPSTDYMIDEDDRVFYDTARMADAYLITGNKKHFPDKPNIITPAEFLSLINSDE
jgi:putative PIN family toxin of toxin-antitoxin system